jgi:uncharacterized protein YyaL (SSP411 family)
MIATRFILLTLAGALAAAPVAAQGGAAQTPPRPAAELVAEARAAAARDQRNVLVEFGASWCGWCRRFEAFLADPDVGRIMHDHFVVVHLTALESGDRKPLENAGATELLREMGGTGGIPFYFVVDPAGKKLADANGMPDGGNIGHPATAGEIDAFDRLLQRTAPRMTAAERARIRAHLAELSRK